VARITPAAPLDLYIGPLDPRNQMVLTVVCAAASAGHFQAFTVNRRVTVSTVYFRVGTQSGNIDFGIYNSAGSRLASTGSFAAPTVGVTKSQALTASLVLEPNVLYYALWSADNVTVAISGISTTQWPVISGYTVKGTLAAGVFPLPISVTISDSAAAGTSPGIWFA
jgi:hypothetical protein